jgi:hypothetical protein
VCTRNPQREQGRAPGAGSARVSGTVGAWRARQPTTDARCTSRRSVVADGFRRSVADSNLALSAASYASTMHRQGGRQRAPRRRRMDRTGARRPSLRPSPRRRSRRQSMRGEGLAVDGVRCVAAARLTDLEIDLESHAQLRQVHVERYGIDVALECSLGDDAVPVSCDGRSSGATHALLSIGVVALGDSGLKVTNGELDGHHRVSRSMLTAVQRLSGQVATGPMLVPDQPNERMRSPIPPPTARKFSLEATRKWDAEDMARPCMNRALPKARDPHQSCAIPRTRPLNDRS